MPSIVGENGVYVARFANGAAATITPLGLAFLALAGALVLLLPRKYVVVPLLLVAFFVGMAQTIVVAGLHFQMIRIMVIFCWIRVIVSHRSWQKGGKGFKLNNIDKAFAFWAVSSFVAFSLLWGSSDAAVNRLGFLYNAFGIYFFFRLICRDGEDVNRISQILIWICVVLSVCMLSEQLTGRNLFSILGGVPGLTAIRGGKLRSQASFGNAITAGIFGAVLMPLFLSLLQARKRRATAGLGVIAATVITFTSASSTPISVYAAGILGMCIWPLRKSMRMLRWAVVVLLVVLHMVMKAPVWALISRFDFQGGSGYHRYVLVDTFINHFWDWCVIGYRYPEQWGWYTGDQANEYIFQGETGGLLTLALFLLIITRSFGRLGKARRAAGSDSAAARRLWALGCVLFAHCLALIGIDYFDQSSVNLYLLLAMISATTAVCAVPVAPQAEPVHDCLTERRVEAATISD